MTQQQTSDLIKKYTERWNNEKRKPPLWVVGAHPGDSICIPGLTFANKGDMKAGMEILISAQVIVLNQDMLPDSIASTFLHEYGHALHRNSKAGSIDWVESEIDAIKFSLSALSEEGLDDIAYREAATVLQMTSDEPYKSAVSRLSEDPVWKKFSRH
jgi:hypothetical protein